MKFAKYKISVYERNCIASEDQISDTVMHMDSWCVVDLWFSP